MELLGYRFKNEALAQTALTTPACKIDHPDVVDNQRLEFLGDSIINFLAAERLYAVKPDEQEGSLTVRRTHMVSTAALCESAVNNGIVPLLKRNRGAEELPRNSKTLADAVEAIVGAAYLDGGMAAASAVFEALGVSANAAKGEWSENPKGELQEFAQRMNPPRHPVYELVNVSGKAHEPVFTVRVSVEGIGEAVATAHNRKEAEAGAARTLIKENVQ